MCSIMLGLFTPVAMISTNPLNHYYAYYPFLHSVSLNTLDIISPSLIPALFLSSSLKVNLGMISVRSDIYTIIHRIFYGCLLYGQATSCWHVKCKNRNYVIKDTWTHKGQQFCEEEILKKIKGVEGVPHLVDAWTVEIRGLQDWTSTHHLSFPSSNNEVRV